MKLDEMLLQLGLAPEEAVHLMQEAKTPNELLELNSVQLNRIDQTVGRMVGNLAGQDWRRADGADRGPDNVNQIGPFDVFNKKTGEHRKFETFGDLLRRSLAEYGWKS